MDAEKRAGFNILLAMEVKKRLEQLDKLYEQISEKHARFMKLNFAHYLELESLRNGFHRAQSLLRNLKREKKWTA